MQRHLVHIVQPLMKVEALAQTEVPILVEVQMRVEIQTVLIPEMPLKIVADQTIKEHPLDQRLDKEEGIKNI